MLGLALHTWDPRGKAETQSSADFFLTCIRQISSFQSHLYFRMFMSCKTHIWLEKFIVLLQTLNFAFHFWGNKVSPSSTFVICPVSSVAPRLRFFSPRSAALEFWGSKCYEASRQAISRFGFLVCPVARMSSASLPWTATSKLPFPHLSFLASQIRRVTARMTAQRFRQPGSWANNQLWLCNRNKAALILLIGRNVLSETRKRLIQTGLNQSHAPGTEFQEDTCWTTVLSSHRWLQRSRPAHPQNNVSSWPLSVHCFRATFNTSILFFSDSASSS